MIKKEFLGHIVIKGAKQNNLKNLHLSIPLNSFTVVTGVSGSGKSSLVFDTLFRESRSGFLKSTIGFSSKFTGKLLKSDVDEIENLPASISLSQNQKVNSSRSTVGTLSEIYDLLRLLYARYGIPSKGFQGTQPLRRSLFSFNSPEGACGVCKGLGTTEKLSVDLLISDAKRSISEGCFKITNPNGYIMYSQVTPEVLETICEAEGFSVNTPWNELTEENRTVILYGSTKLKVPFGKHSLESRMKWTGITAKPREEGFYKGIIPVMEEILKRDRNPNILKYTESCLCDSCKGKRLNEEALKVLYIGEDIGELSKRSISEIDRLFRNVKTFGVAEKNIIRRLTDITGRIKKLGMGYLTLNRGSSTLGGGEIRVLRLVNQVVSGIRGILYLFDEPTTGLHSENIVELNHMIRKLVEAGNTVVAVTHDAGTILSSDYVVEIGPVAGNSGGKLVFAGSSEKFISSDNQSLTAKYLRGEVEDLSDTLLEEEESFHIKGCGVNNLKNIDFNLLKNRINTVSGVPGAGKTSLLKHIVDEVNSGSIGDGSLSAHFIDKSPIGKSPRSNPATYTGVFTHIRDIFGGLPEARDKGLKKSHFSFNVKGGRCEACEGAGVITIGMHFLGNAEIECDKCRGTRFKTEVLKIRYRGKNIDEVLGISFDEAQSFFKGNSAIEKYIHIVVKLGLGYLKLGQPSTTLSGGEAQRIKLASEMVKSVKGNGIYVFDEPCQGLHFQDVKVFQDALKYLAQRGNTVVVAEYDLTFIKNSNWVIDLGPGSGSEGGRVVFAGVPDQLLKNGESLTAEGIRKLNSLTDTYERTSGSIADIKSSIVFEGVRTNNLKNLNVEIELNRTTAVTGVSGSGKSSLVFDTLFAEGYNRYLESYSPYMRSVLGEAERPDVEVVNGIIPSIGVGIRNRINNPRATVGTVTGIYDLLRLLFSRVGEVDGERVYGDMRAGDFSFNSEYGACRSCRGLGFVEKCSSSRLISHSHLSLLKGAMDGTKTGQFYGDPYGQYTAHLKAVGEHEGIDYNLPVAHLSEEALNIAMYGTGDTIYEVIWEFNRKGREGKHKFEGKWQGFCNLVEEEYSRKRGRKSGDQLKSLIVDECCKSCGGSGLKGDILMVKVEGKNIYQYASMDLLELCTFFHREIVNSILDSVGVEIVGRCRLLIKLGLGYLSCARRVKTLSAGETSRLIISSGVGGGLSQLLYLIDEPASGLHPADYKDLIEVFEELNRRGNSLVIVEHDPFLVDLCHKVIQLGPGGGQRGGEVVEYQRPDYNPSWSSVGYEPEDSIIFKRCCARNLKNINVHIPLNRISAITGVSGSGKSSLLFDVIYNSLKTGVPVNCSTIDNIGAADFVLDFRGSSKVNGSMPAIMVGVFDEIRGVFAATDEARKRSLNKSCFSVTGKGGRCEECGGKGFLVRNLDFISDVKEVCPQCEGKRYKPEVLECLYQGKSIFDVLDMEVEEGLEFFRNRKKTVKAFALLKDAGLGYLKIGQHSGTLSTGETGRILLASNILKGEKRTIYLMDEPFRGLHTDDCRSLMVLFRRLCDEGNTILMTEHNPWVVASSDYLVDIGPEGGKGGGKLIFQGKPSELKNCEASATGRELRRRF